MRDFDATLKLYLKVSSRTMAEALNEKAYFILNGSPKTRGAVALTQKADKAAIASLMGATYRTTQKRDTTKQLKRAKLEFNSEEKYYNLQAVRIIIGRMKKAGKSIPDKEALIEMAKKMVGARLRSIGFISSGWIPAIKRLARFSKSGRGQNTARQVGAAKGGVTIANESSPTVKFWNSAGDSKGSTRKNSLAKYGAPALEAAFAQETASMKAYLEGKLKKAAQECGIKTG